MKYNIGDILIYDGPVHEVDVYKMKIIKITDQNYHFERIISSLNNLNNNFSHGYIDRYFILDKESIWNRDLAEILL